MALIIIIIKKKMAKRVFFLFLISVLSLFVCNFIILTQFQNLKFNL